MSELPKGWNRTILEDVADVLDFEREPINSSDRDNRINGKSKSDLYPYYGATGQVGFIDAFRSEGQRVLLGEDAAPFLDPIKDKAYLANGRFWVNNHAHVLAGAAGLIDNEFLCHQLNTVDYRPFVTGSTRLKLTSAAMKQIPMVVAPYVEQTRIVAKLEELLSDLDAGVAELKAAQKKLAQYRQSLLKAAVDGSLTAEWRKNNPPTETGAQLLEQILKERRARWEEKQLAKSKEQGKTPPKDWQKKYPEPVLPNTTELSALPTSWAWASLDQSAAESLIGLDRGQEQQSSSAAFGYIKMNNVSMNGHVDVQNITRVNATQEEVDKYAVALNDVLFNTRNSLELVGKTGLVIDLDGVTLYNNNLMRLRFDGALKPAFACFQMCGPEFRTRLERVKKATTSVAAVYAKDLFPLAIAVPPISEQTEILRILDLAMAAIDAQQLSIERSFKQAAAQRQNILRAAFAGELVPQDPNDEPASVLLERIRAERSQQTIIKKPRGRKAKETNNA